MPNIDTTKPEHRYTETTDSRFSSWTNKTRKPKPKHINIRRLPADTSQDWTTKAENRPECSVPFSEILKVKYEFN
jgi:hypothetical protein